MNRRRLIPAVVAIIAAVVVILLLTRGESESNRPRNVLLITLDTTRADHIGCYGDGDALTPAIDALAKSGVQFDKTFCTVPLTLPSHATMLTGLQPVEHGLRVNASGKLGEDVPTLATILAKRGYRTGAFIAAYALDSTFGLDRGFDVYEDDLSGGYEPDPYHPVAAYRPGNQVVDSALSWLGQVDDRPFFCWVHLYDPHLPYYAHEELKATKFAGQASYAAEIAFMDLQVARLMQFIQENKLDRDTLVMAVGDHGEGLGDHGEEAHGLMLYDTTLHVPMIWSWPGHLPEGVNVPASVSLVDLFPTLLDLLGVQDHPESMGQSFRPALFADAIDDRYCYAETDMPYTEYQWSPLRCLITPGYKYIRTPIAELYDRENDPRELANLAADLPDLVASFDSELSSLEAGMVRHQIQKVELAPEAQQILKTLGYAAPPLEHADTTGLDWQSLRDVKDGIKATALTSLFRELRARSQLEQAAEAARKAVDMSPESGLLQHDLGSVLLELGRPADALEPLREAVRLMPNRAMNRTDYGNALLKTGHADEALAQYTEAMLLVPANAIAHANLASAMMLKGMVNKAMSHCREAIKLDPDLFAARYHLARALMQKNLVNESIAEFKETLRIDPESAEIHDLLGQQYVKLGLFDDAISHLRRAVEIEPDNDSMCADLGLAYTLANRPGPAIEQYERAVEINPDNARAHDSLCAAYLQQREFEKSARHGREAVRIEPDNAEARGNLANALLNTGAYDEVIEQCREAIRLKPDLVPAHFNMGVALLETGQPAEAEKHFRYVLSLQPGDPMVQNALRKAREQIEAGASTAPAGTEPAASP